VNDETQTGSGFRLWMLAPALGAAAVLAVFMLGLQRDDGGRNLPSTFIDKPAPEFELPPLREGQPGLSSADMKAPGVKLVNIWASWCVPCRIEPELGDPFTLIGADRKGRVGIEWGVYGVPETFVIDGQGRIIYKHIGPIQGSDIGEKILPAVEKAKSGG
jgi:cytochrome c biogenesis protein CcmG/thiol:disulfide interchange protein DsbE